MQHFYALARGWHLLGILLGLLAVSSAQAQAPVWSGATAGSITQVNGTSITQATALDAGGNVFVTGSFTGTVAFGTLTLTSRGYHDLFVAKYVPATSTWAWAQSGGGTDEDAGYGIAVSGANIYVTGYLTNTTANTQGVLFGSSGATPSTVTQYGASATSSPDIVVAKYTDNGATATLGWTQVGGGAGDDRGYGLAVNGPTVYLTGQLTNSTANGSSVRFGGSGPTAGTAGQSGASSAITQDLVVAKYTDNGATATLGWTQVGGGNREDAGSGITVSGSSLYVTGYITNNRANTTGVLFGTGTTGGSVTQYGATVTPVSTPVLAQDLVVAKYTDNGATATLGWTQVGGGITQDYGTGIAVSGASVYVTGVITNNTTNDAGVLFGGAGRAAGTVVQHGASFSTNNDIVVAKYTDNGATATLGWTQVGGGVNQDVGTGIAVSGSSVYITGFLRNSTSLFGGSGTIVGTATQNEAAAGGSRDIVVAKYTDNGATATLGWTQVAGGTGDDWGYGLAVRGTSVYLAGYVSSSYTPLSFGAAPTASLLGTAESRAVLAELRDNTTAGSWQAVAPTTNGGTSFVQATAVDAAGSVFVTGYFTGAVTLGSTLLTSRGLTDVFVAKYVPSTATWAWAQSGGGIWDDQGYGIAVSGTSVYLTGYITNSTFNTQTVLFGGAVPQYGASTFSREDILVAKYLDNGSSATLAWTQVAGGTQTDIGTSIAVSGSSVYVTGTLTNSLSNTTRVIFGGAGSTAGTAPQYGANATSGKDLVVAKYTDNGATATFGWSQVGGGSADDQGAGIAVRGSSVYLTGYISNTTANANAVLFGGSGSLPGTAPQYGTSTSTTLRQDLVVAKYTDNGPTATLGWTQVGGGAGQDQGTGIAVQGANVYVTGIVTNSQANPNNVLFGGGGPTAGTLPQYGASPTISADALLAKYTDNGATATLNWTQVGGGTGADAATGLAVTGNSLYLTGYLTNTMSNTNAVLFGGSGATPGTVSQTGATATVSPDVLVAKYTDTGMSGALAWTQVAGGSGTDAGNGVAVSGQQVYVGGSVEPVAIFGSFLLGGAVGAGTSFLARLTDLALPLAGRQASALAGLALFPNPTRWATTLSGASPGQVVQVVDALGREVGTSITDAAGTAALVLPARLPAGLYVVRAGPRALRLVVE